MIRGSLGEVVDRDVVRLVDPVSPVRSRLERRATGVDLDLELLDLKHLSFDGEVIYRDPFTEHARSDDDIAVADLLARTGAWAREEGEAPCELAQACQDHLLPLAIEESAASGRTVTTSREAWAD